MHDSSRGSSRNNAGRGASLGLLFAVTVGFSAACGSDDEAPAQSSNGANADGANAAGASGQASGAAGAGNPLRGEGFEPTPTFDITNPDREPPGREELIEGIGNLNGAGGSGSSAPTPADAGTPDGGDAS